MLDKLSIISKYLGIFLFFFPPASDAMDLSLLTPRALGIGGASVAIGTRQSLNVNPSLLAVVDERYDIYFNAPSYIRSTSDRTTFEKALTHFQNEVERYAQDSTPQNQQIVTNQLRRLQNVVSKRQLQLSSSVSFPHLPISLATFVNAQYFETTIATPGNPILTTTNAPQDNALVTLKAIALIETGAHFATVIDSTGGGSNRLAIGLSPKLVSTRSYYFNASAQTITLDQQPKQMINESQLNFDVGLLKEFAYTWKLGIVIRNILPQKVTYADHSSRSIGRQIKLGIANRHQALLYTIELDITKNKAITYEKETRLIKMGAEYALNHHIILRGGFYKNIMAVDRANLSVGLGITSRWLDVDVGLSSNFDEYITGIQFSTQY